ncbi:MAG TPA: S8 family peptidase [Tabrizicola sp.]|nr:S8 family peptidase [Tabrizicola sp.]
MFLWPLSALALTGCGGGEEGGDAWFTIAADSGGTGLFGSYFMASITDEWREAAASFRENNPRFVRQDGTFTISGVQVFANPLHSSRVDYAHAVGLTGAGAVIAIVDSGFRRTHETFAGKSITTTGNPIVTDHGTMVASVAAGNSSSMVGVAPGADLILSDWGNVVFDNLRLAAIEAQSRRAVAQNNSWGYTDSPVGQASFDEVFGSTAGTNWLNALRSYALGAAGWSGGVVVFAVDNQDTGSAGIMDALPSIAGQGDLARAWIAVGNAIPVFDDSRVTSVARLESSPCYQSGPWCIMADGAWVGASATSNTSYQSRTGSSFTAPQVSGALALLAEAFPGLTPHQLRLRLLASADNRFTGFSATGTIDLDESAGVLNHDWSTLYGHGFLDIRAALLPIGQTTLAMSDGTSIKTQDYAFTTGGAMGDAVTRGLEGIEMTVSDQLGGSFDVAAKAFVATAAPAARSFDKDFHQARTAPLSPLAETFAAHPGKSLDLAGPDGSRASILLGGTKDYGIALSQRLGDGDLALDLGVKFVRDGGSLMGFSGSGGSDGAAMASVMLALSSDTGEGGFFALSGELGVADLGTTAAIASSGSTSFNAVRLDLGGRDVMTEDDRLSLGISLPIAVTSGSAEMLVPVASASGAAETRSIGIDLAPQDRQIDLSISYGVPTGNRSEFRIELVHSMNYGNRAGATDTSGALGIAFRF